MNPKNLFKWRHFAAEIITLNLKWYLSYALSYRNLEEMMLDRGLKLDHTTIYRWVQQYAPELNQTCRKYLRKTNDSYRVDETYIKIKGIWHYLYRALDSRGDTIDFMLSHKRNAKAAKRFFRKFLGFPNSLIPRVINVDMDKAYPLAFKNLKKEQKLLFKCKLRRVRYLNNIIEQDHRFIKKLVRAGLGFKSFITASKTLQGYEAMHMIRKGQLKKSIEVKENMGFLFKIAA